MTTNENKALTELAQDVDEALAIPTHIQAVSTAATPTLNNPGSTDTAIDDGKVDNVTDPNETQDTNEEEQVNDSDINNPKSPRPSPINRRIKDALFKATTPNMYRHCKYMVHLMRDEVMIKFVKGGEICTVSKAVALNCMVNFNPLMVDTPWRDPADGSDTDDDNEDDGHTNSDNNVVGDYPFDRMYAMNVGSGGIETPFSQFGDTPSLSPTINLTHTNQANPDSPMSRTSASIHSNRSTPNPTPIPTPIPTPSPTPTQTTSNSSSSSSQTSQCESPSPPIPPKSTTTTTLDIVAKTQQSIVALMGQLVNGQQQPNETSDSASTKVMTKMFEKSAVVKFAGKWPKDKFDAYLYCWMAQQHEMRFDELSALTIYRSIIDTLSDNNRNQHNDWLTMKNLPKTLMNFVEYVVTKFNATVSKHDLDAWTSTIKIRDNEDPTSFIEHVKLLQRKANCYLVYNGLVTGKMTKRLFDDDWVLKTLINELIFNAYGKGTLNAKFAKLLTRHSELSDIVAENGATSSANAKAELKMLLEAVQKTRPKVMGHAVLEVQQKDQFQTFDHNGMESLSSFLRKLRGGQPPSKKRRRTNPDEQKDCPLGAKCSYFLRTGSCWDKHSEAELTKMRQIRSDKGLADGSGRGRGQRRTVSFRSRGQQRGRGRGRGRRTDFGGRKYDEHNWCEEGHWCQSIRRTNQCEKEHRQCDNGNECRAWQVFRCGFVHDSKAMRCSKCKGNHRAAQCPKNPDSSQSSSKEYPRYDGKDFFTGKVKTAEKSVTPAATSVTPRMKQVLAMKTRRTRMTDIERDAQLRAAYEIVEAAKTQRPQ